MAEALATARARRPRSATTPDEIVAAAIELFARQGYRGTSVKAIAARVGITDAGVLYHFPVKIDIFWAVVDAFSDLQAERLREMVAPGGLAAIRNLGEWGAVMQERPDLLALQVVLTAEGLAGESDIHGYYVERYRDLCVFVRGLIEQGAEQGDVRADVDADYEAVALLAHLDGARVQWLYSNIGFPLADSVRTYVTDMIARITVPAG